ncbi:hypothetical protein AGABI2DRAFT_195086 [Agaricus bisporus var. bisporus H97]|uniref:hypothetical protein n=1 Tax=Agaricus bisporus var. bisporus (strain H97 / ATCC MYA-4626 / FGSC 10389) TaxID=936046 RepID=UPI00029F7050|nr:hypothetical protein AGABI2DRAFT_195086 [Agaricus bisporus var. bisporus H97]EKV43454.1 hypothetical protein AGABI2DRAFT_195086 [Agaricus bisporus var. bisporus H97]
MLNEMRDTRIARRMQDALCLDRELIQELVLSERVAQQDREAAVALNQGMQLPRLTDEQRAMDGYAIVPGDNSFMSSDMLEALSPKLKEAPGGNFDKGKSKVVSFGPSTSSFLLGSSNSISKPVERPQCVSCDDRIPPGRASLKAPCDHHYCAACIAQLVRAATTDESLFPVRCCRTTIPTASLTHVLSSALLATFQAKVKEFGTPANARVYCTISTCSAFLGNADEAKRQQPVLWYTPSQAKLRCERCRVETCVECRRPAHPNDICKHNQAVQEVKDLARTQGWQTCPRCERIIELSIGCNHMTCYCGFEFCYECAAKWKTCGCEQWEERRLYATAEARMERDLGAQAQREAPVQWRRQVEEFAQNLRVNHDCYPGHRWKGQGPGECEECGSYMPVFLKMCRDCRLTVCRRCALNRL